MLAFYGKHTYNARMKKDFDPNSIIDLIGGTTKVARICEVEPQAVSQWRKTGIPNARLMFLKLKRPKIFRQLKKAA